MFSRQMIIEHHMDSLDNLSGAYRSSLQALHKSFELLFKISRDHAFYPYDWSLAIAEGESPRPASDVFQSGFKASTHLVTEHYAELVQTFEAQLHVISKSAHRMVDQIQYWSPRGIEPALGRIDCVVDAAETSADQLADASVEIARSMEASLAGTNGRRRSAKATRAA
ncbi:MAG TPA: hypothetical protein PLN31_18530 [Azoarcus taiwanensis]|uniref:Phasin domain-containing protein n=1 Tax=Azoarcus taiwanensis TaxID=666964 RepID=A0A972FAC9_9RHOO|nr:hypothetical protein [Azoarcus taiwanensis]NMG04835.1 hypothetical protein [Azoarcus taiwanensis]HRQ59415.1 hypothetical protein [Azoarcus taiwanensis]